MHAFVVRRNLAPAFLKETQPNEKLGFDETYLQLPAVIDARAVFMSRGITTTKSCICYGDHVYGDEEETYNNVEVPEGKKTVGDFLHDGSRNYSREKR